MSFIPVINPIFVPKESFLGQDDEPREDRVSRGFHLVTYGEQRVLAFCDWLSPATPFEEPEID